MTTEASKKGRPKKYNTEEERTAAQKERMKQQWRQHRIEAKLAKLRTQLGRDLTPEEIRQLLYEEHGQSASIGSVRRFFVRHGISFNKK